MSNGEHQDRIFLALMGASTAAAAAVVGILGLGWKPRRDSGRSGTEPPPPTDSRPGTPAPLPRYTPRHADHRAHRALPSARAAPSAAGAASGTARDMTISSFRNVRSITGLSGGPTGASSPAATYPPATTPGGDAPGAGFGGPSSTTTGRPTPTREWPARTIGRNVRRL